MPKHSFHPLIWAQGFFFLFSVRVFLIFVSPRAFGVQEGSWGFPWWRTG